MLRPRPGAVVEHRVDQQLEGEGDLPSVERHLGHRRGQSAPGAGAADGQARGVDAELRPTPVQPGQRGVAVLRRGRGAVRGGEPVVDRGDHDAERPGELEAMSLILRGAAHDEPAAVDPEQGRGRGGREPGAVDAQRHRWGPIRSGDVDLPDLHIGRGHRQAAGDALQERHQAGRDVRGRDPAREREIGVEPRHDHSLPGR